MASLMKGVRDFIKTCPYLEEFNKGIGVDYMEGGYASYMLENTPCNPIVEQFVDGSTTRRFAFVFASREPYGPDVIMNLENIEFFEKFAGWLEDCTRAGELPELGEYLDAWEMQASVTPYLYTEDLDAAQYRIQCELIYFKPAPDSVAAKNQEDENNGESE